MERSAVRTQRDIFDEDVGRWNCWDCGKADASHYELDTWHRRCPICWMKAHPREMGFQYLLRYFLKVQFSKLCEQVFGHRLVGGREPLGFRFGRRLE